ncbi:MAG: hypothetical protein Q8916_03940, partial [Bacteroidota bacterium]|nr:hypothetical protein [Bacteroidota bacterium]MDP4229539.1 hypothetical protein [Bacteroidota bacterium]MDP4235124.1 hypothetical protein [Bacteroidota bacterium]
MNYHKPSLVHDLVFVTMLVTSAFSILAAVFVLIGDHSEGTYAITIFGAIAALSLFRHMKVGS